MLDQTPVRRHVDISAQTGAQLELRLLWFGRALAVRRGYIVTVDRHSSRPGRHVASIAYEMPLPSYARSARQVTREASQREALQRQARSSLGSGAWDRELGQEQGSSAGGM
jgi:hypothetical protein